MENGIELTIVEGRCIYLNNKRVKGGKPYYSERLPQKDYEIEKSEIVEALIYKDQDMKEALRILKEHQDWRQGESKKATIPAELTKSINTILNFFN